MRFVFLFLMTASSAHAELLSVESVTLGDSHACALLTDRTAKCWGRNEFGQLGYGDTETRGDEAYEMGEDLATVDLGYPVIAISAGASHTCALLEGGRVKCWGRNDVGQLGSNDGQAHGDDPGEMGAALSFVSLNLPARAIDAGAHHTCALLEDRSVTCWGMVERNSVNLGQGAVAIDAGAGYACALLEDRNVKCWGSEGEVRTVAGLDQAAVHVSVGTFRACAMLDSGRVKCWGWFAGEMSESFSVDEFSQNATLVASGALHVCAAFADGGSKCLGNNANGQLGLGDRRDRVEGENVPNLEFELPVAGIAAGASNTCVVFVNGGVKCWGDNTYGQLGLSDTESRGDDPDELERLPFIPLWW